MQIKEIQILGQKELYLYNEQSSTSSAYAWPRFGMSEDNQKWLTFLIEKFNLPPNESTDGLKVYPFPFSEEEEERFFAEAFPIPKEDEGLEIPVSMFIYFKKQKKVQEFPIGTPWERVRNEARKPYRVLCFCQNGNEFCFAPDETLRSFLSKAKFSEQATACIAKQITDRALTA